MLLRPILLLLTIVYTFQVVADDKLKVNAELSTKMSPSRREIISHVFSKIEALEFNDEKLSPEFKKYYGKDRTALVSYLNDRVKFIVDEYESFSHRSLFSPEAVHLSMVLWVSALYAGKQVNYITLNEKNIEIKSPRSGIVQLNGPFYSSNLELIFKISLLLHEARHSDCSHKININENREFDLLDCGYPHISGGGVEKDRDRFPWGAYAASYLFGEAMANACTNCTEDEKMMGLIIQSDSQSRIQPFRDSPKMTDGE